MSARQIASELGRSVAAVQRKLHYLGELKQPPLTYTLAQVCRLTGRADDTVRGWLVSKQLKGARSENVPGGRLGAWVIHRADLRAFLRTHPRAVSDANVDGEALLGVLLLPVTDTDPNGARLPAGKGSSETKEAC